MSRILFIHDFTSPFCRLAVEAVAEAAERTGRTVRPVPFELWPEPAPLPPVAASPFREEMNTALPLAGEWGLTLRQPPTLPRTRKAHEAVAYAIQHGAALALTQEIYEAFWSNGVDIARLDLLADIGEAAGLEREPLHVALGLDEYEADVVREQHAVAGAELNSVPAFQIGSVVAAGVLPADELVAWIEENGGPP